MPSDKLITIIILVLAISGLVFVFFVNINDSLAFLADPLVGDGLGTLCSSETECENFCQNNHGRCDDYCSNNPTNKLCDILFK